MAQELSNLTNRINSAAQKHAAFKKDTEARKRLGQRRGYLACYSILYTYCIYIHYL